MTGTIIVVDALKKRIEILETENARLQEVLNVFACTCTGRCEDMEWLPADNMLCARRDARVTLEGKKK